MSKQSNGEHPEVRERSGNRKKKKPPRPYHIYVDFKWRNGKKKKFRLGRYETLEQAEVVLEKHKREIWGRDNLRIEKVD